MGEREEGEREGRGEGERKKLIEDHAYPKLKTQLVAIRENTSSIVISRL